MEVMDLFLQRQFRALSFDGFYFINLYIFNISLYLFLANALPLLEVSSSNYAHAVRPMSDRERPTQSCQKAPLPPQFGVKNRFFFGRL